jgi:ArsR family transcriptional regulator
MSMSELIDQLKALSDETRLRVFKLVQQRELCVCQIVPAIGLSQPTVSAHLAKLKRAGLVKERRARPWSHYSVDQEGLALFQRRLSSFLAADLSDLPEIRDLARKLPPPLCAPGAGPGALDRQRRNTK